jgi:hypothetical protein
MIKYSFNLYSLCTLTDALHTCKYKADFKWTENPSRICDNLAGWLNTMMVDNAKEGQIKAMLYNLDTEVFIKLSSGNMEVHNIKERVTVGAFLDGTPHGLVWQYRGGEILMDFYTEWLIGRVSLQGKISPSYTLTFSQG